MIPITWHYDHRCDWFGYVDQGGRLVFNSNADGLDLNRVRPEPAFATKTDMAGNVTGFVLTKVALVLRRHR